MTDIIQIDSDTWRFEDGHVRFFLLEGDKKAALIDSGISCPDAADMAKTVTDKPLMLINTHGDGDHTSGTGGFSEIRIHPLDYVHCGIGSKFPGTKLVEINDGDIIDLGNRPLRIIFIPGHTKGSIAILDVNKRVLYSGDTVQKGHIYMFGEKREPSQYEGSLDKLAALKNEYDCIYASHDEYLVPNDYAKKVKSVWLKVRGGEIPYEEIVLHGYRVKSFTNKTCGFYTD